LLIACLYFLNIIFFIIDGLDYFKIKKILLSESILCVHAMAAC